MTRFIRAVVVTAAVLVAGATPTTAQAVSTVERFSFDSEHMGTSFRLVAYAQEQAQAHAAATAAFAHIARLDSLFSDYRPDSEIAHLASQAGGGALVPISDELWALLREAAAWSERTDGAFDVTIGPLSQLWRWAARRGELPEPDRVRSAKAIVGFQSLAIDPAKPLARLERSGMSLDLGAIAKGYAADAALGVLAQNGIPAALVDAGGDVAVGTRPPGTAGWLVTLPDGSSLRLENSAIATSGDTHRYVIVDGVRYGHVVDPRTGLGVVDAPTVTVVAPTATTADALASALTVMDTASGVELTRSVEGAWASVIGRVTWTTGAYPEPSEHATSNRDPQ